MAQIKIDDYEDCIRRLSQNGGCTRALRRMVFLHGVPQEQCATKTGTKSCSLRAQIWKVMLGVNAVSAHRYETLLSKGEHETFGKKIRNDAFRTFQQDCVFAQRVPENKLIRVLNAFAHAQGNKFPYVQGLNALCGPLLYVMPELDAFYCFEQLVTRVVPMYATKNLLGAHAGCSLVHECMKAVDPEIASFLEEELEFRTDEQRCIYSLAPVFTMGACAMPLKHVIRQWDRCLAVGAHMNLVFIVSNLILKRNEILQSGISNIPRFLTGREQPVIQPDQINAMLNAIIFRIPTSLLTKLKDHAVRSLASTTNASSSAQRSI